MPNEETLGPRKTMVVLVIVVGCFAVLWPRILSPLVLGTAKDQLKPNQFDRDAGCCEVLFESEVAVLELLNEVCASSLQADGKLSPYAAAECRKTVNETCGVDIHAFLKRSDNVGKTTKVLLDTMKASNSSCLKEHFGVPVWSISTHPALNAWTQQDTLKQERPARLPGPHPALRERGRAIPVGVPPTPPPRPAPLPPHVRVRSSPLQGYFELEMQPPPIPGMRPPLGSPGGPVAAPKSSMGFVMPIYTICIIVFFVYTLSKILFKRSGGAPYEHVASDPQFRRRVFRDDSRSSPDKLGDVELEALRERLAQTERAMQRIVGSLAARQADVQDNHARPYSNGTVIHSGPVQIVASEYREPSDAKEPSVDEREPSPEPEVLTIESEETAPEMDESGPEPKELTPEPSVELREPSVEPKEPTPEPNEALEAAQQEESPEQQTEESKDIDAVEELKKLTDNIDSLKDSVVTLTENLLNKEKENLRLEIEVKEGAEEKQSTPELLEEALREDSSTNDEEEKEEAGNENASVKVVGMEVSAHTADGRAWRGEGPPRAPPPPPPPRPHEAEQVQSIFLDAQIPQQSRVLVADFAGVAHAPPAARHAPTVVSGKMTLSLIQDAPRDTPDRDLESTLDEFTTASALTQPAGENEEDLSDEEVDEEIEVEEMEEEVEEVDEEVGEVEEEVEEVEEEAGEVEEKPREAAAKE